MNKYSFLFKPVFFIFSLLFATWLVLYIERISPSDLGKYESIFNSGPKKLPEEHKVQSTFVNDKRLLKKLYTDYNAGLIDSTELDNQLEKILISLKQISHNQK